MAIDTINLEIERGEFIVLCGPSGSGKSTLLNLAGGIEKATHGDIFFAGRNISALNDHQMTKLRADYTGIIFQFFNLLPVLTVFDNIYYPLMLNGVSRRQAKEQVMDVIEQVGLLRYYQRIPGQLSGGQQQRVAIARALVKRPALVIADEPTGNLDSVTGQSITELLSGINQRLKTTFIISTHSTALRRQASRVIDIQDGKIKNDQ